MCASDALARCETETEHVEIRTFSHDLQLAQGMPIEYLKGTRIY